MKQGRQKYSKRKYNCRIQKYIQEAMEVPTGCTGDQGSLQRRINFQSNIDNGCQ